MQRCVAKGGVDDMRRGLPWFIAGGAIWCVAGALSVWLHNNHLITVAFGAILFFGIIGAGRVRNGRRPDR
jgi:hypothetical protein